jgi:NADPH:quinone reductase-like Zn-dependent oxidoreductase
LKALVYTKYGNPEVLQLKELPKPLPRENEVLIKVHAVSVNDWDLGLLQGDWINRMLFGFFKPRKQILGSDIAGVVEAVGANVHKFNPGDKVFGDLSGTWGGFAEYVCASENALALMHGKMSFEEAAAIPQAGMLAVQGLIDMGQIQSGQKLLINGAGGGVGTFALQIAKSFGAEITAVDKTEKLAMLQELGADHVIDFTQEDFTKNGQRYDLILDVKTHRSVLNYVRSLTTNGMYVTVGGEMKYIFQMLFLTPIFSFFGKRKLKVVALKVNKDLDLMSKLFIEHKLRPVIDGPYKFEDTPRALNLFESGAHKGKIVIKVTAD